MSSLKVGELYGELGLDDSPFNRKLGMAGKHLGGLTKIAAGAALGMGAAMAGGAAYSLFEFGKLEKGMNEVFTLLPGISEQAMGEMRGQVQSLSAEMGVMTGEMVPALYQSLSAGVPQDNVFAFLRTATEAGIAGVATTEDAVSALTTGMNIFNESADSVADALFTTVKRGVTTFPELVRALGTVGPAAKASGVSLDELAAAMATATKKIPDTAKVSTSLVQVFSELDKEGSKINTTLQEMGYKTVASAKEQFGSFQGVLQALYKHVGNNETAFKNLFGSVEGANVALTLIGDGAGIAAEDLAAMGDKAGAAGEAFDTMDQGLSRSMDKIKANAQVMVQKVGEKLAPFAADVTDWLVAAGPSLDTFAGKLQNIIDLDDIDVNVRLDLAGDELELLLVRLGMAQDRAHEVSNTLEGMARSVMLVVDAGKVLVDMLMMTSAAGAMMGKSFGYMTAGVINAFAQMADEIMGGLQGIVHAMDAIPGMGGDWVDSFDDAAQSVTEFADNQAAGADRIREAMQQDADSFMKWADAGGEAMSDIGVQAQEIYSLFDEPLAAPELDEGSWEYLKQAAEITGSDSIAAFLQGIDKQSPEVQAKAQEITGLTITELMTLPDFAGSYGGQMTSSLGVGIGSKSSEVSTASKSLAWAAVSPLNIDLFPQGANASASFASGLASHLNDVAIAAGNLANAAKAQLEANLDAHSPSRVMMAISEDAMEGLLIPLRDHSGIRQAIGDIGGLFRDIRGPAIRGTFAMAGAPVGSSAAGNTVINISGGMSFPNVRSGADAEDFLSEIASRANMKAASNLTGYELRAS